MFRQGSGECSQFLADDKEEEEVNAKMVFCKGENYVTRLYQ